MMRAIIRRLLGRPAPSAQSDPDAAKRLPAPGETWIFRKDDGSPWPKQGCKVKILDVRDDWVLYDMPVFRDQRLKMTSFLRCYEPVNKVSP